MNTNLILLIALITVTYLFLYCLHRYLVVKSQSYLNFITKHNIQVQFLYITLQTKTFNRLIYKISHINVTKKCQCIKYTHIYNLGVVFTIVSIPVSVYIIGQSIYSNLEKPQSSSLYNLNDNEEHYINVKPLVIGVNLPMSHLLYYIMSLLVCIVIHELGHAVCAIHENIRLNHVGIIVIFIIPVIYVDIENICSVQAPISLFAKLRIYCAGIWHNVLLTLAMYFILYIFPLVISPLYSVDQGVQVTRIGYDSPLKTSAGKFGLEPFDVIYKINECRVLNEVTYKQCLLQLNAGRNKKGYCLTDDFIGKNHENEKSDECCASNQTKHLCFVQIMNETNTLLGMNNSNRIKRHVGNNAHRLGNQDEIGNFKSTDNVNQMKNENSQIRPSVRNKELSSVSLESLNKDNIGGNDNKTPLKYCIQARLVLDNSKQTCLSPDQCLQSRCFSPHTSHSLIQIHVRHKLTYVLYLGRPTDIYNTLSVSKYVQKYTTSVILSYVPTVGYNMAVYISILSSGLALVNAVPCYYFDSQHIVGVLVTRSYVRFLIQAVSTLMLCMYFLLFIPSTLFSTTPVKGTR